MTTMEHKLDEHKLDGNSCTHMDNLDELKLDDLGLDDNHGTHTLTNGQLCGTHEGNEWAREIVRNLICRLGAAQLTCHELNAVIDDPELAHGHCRVGALRGM